MSPVLEVDNFEEFKDEVVKTFKKKKKSDLFAFFLFDQSSSHKAVQVFAKERVGWLDDLADAADTFFFVFVMSDVKHKKIRNPSVEVARLFGILPNQLPGIVLFDMEPNFQTVNSGIYLPLRAKLFENEVAFVEKVFADFFSIIAECQRDADHSATVLATVGKRMRTLKRRQRLRPFIGYLDRNLKAVANLPASITEALANAIARRAAKEIEGS